MKSSTCICGHRGQSSVFTIFLLLLAVALGAYFWVSLNKDDEKPPEEVVEAPEEPEVIAVKPVVKPVEPEPIVLDEPEKEPEIVVVPKVEPPKEKSEVDLLLEKSYPLPNYKPLEELVKNWTEVPTRAFPDTIIVHIGLDYKNSKGGKTVSLGSDHKAKPLKFESGQITVAPVDKPKLKAVVSMDATNFKSRVSELYEEKKEEGIAKVLEKREQNRAKAEAHLAKLKLKPEEKKQASNNKGRNSSFSPRKYGNKFRGDYFPVTKNGKNSELDHEVPMGPIAGVISVSYNKKEAQIIHLWEKGPGSRAGLKIGDTLIKVNGKRFSKYGKSNADGPAGVPEELGLAMIEAQDTNRPLELTVMRGEKTLTDGYTEEWTDKVELTVKVELPALPAFSDNYPEDCERSQAMVEAAAKYLLEIQNKNNDLWKANDYTSAWCGLALLSSGNPKYASKLKKVARALSDKYDMGSSPSNKDLINGSEKGGSPSNWFVSIVGIFLAEYHLATGDKSVLDALDHCCRSMDIRIHPDNGRYGHGRDQHHLPYGGKGLVIINVHAHLMWALAAQIKGLDEWDWKTWDKSYEAVEAAFGGAGGVGYNFSARGGGQSSPRTGAMLTALTLTERKKSHIRSMGGWLTDNRQQFPNVHAMTFIGPNFGFIGLKNLGKSSYSKAFKEYRWLFSLTQAPNYAHGSYYYGDRENSGGDEYCKKRIVGNVMTMIVLNSYKNDTLWMYGNRTKGWYK